MPGSAAGWCAPGALRTCGRRHGQRLAQVASVGCRGGMRGHQKPASWGQALPRWAWVGRAAAAGGSSPGGSSGQTGLLQLTLTRASSGWAAAGDWLIQQQGLDSRTAQPATQQLQQRIDSQAALPYHVHGLPLWVTAAPALQVSARCSCHSHRHSRRSRRPQQTPPPSCSPTLGWRACCRPGAAQQRQSLGPRDEAVLRACCSWRRWRKTCLRSCARPA